MFPELGQALRLFLGQVLQLVWVVFHVVQLPASAFINSAPAFRPNRLFAASQVRSTPSSEKSPAWPSGLVPIDQINKAPTIQWLGFVILDPTVLHQCRQQIDMGRDWIDNCIWFNARRISNEQRYSHTTLVCTALATFHVRIIASTVGAVVGQENEHCVIGNFQLLQLGQDAAHVVVDILNHRIGAGDLGILNPHGHVLLKIFIRNLPRCVRGVVG